MARRRKKKIPLASQQPAKQDVKKAQGMLSASPGLGDPPDDACGTDSGRALSEREIADVKDAGTFEGIDASLPPFTLPPNNYRVELYSALYNYFKQSPLIFDTFRLRFSLPPSA